MSRLPAPVGGSAAVPLDDGILVYDPRAGEVCTLNATAAVVWAACLDGLSEDELVDEVADATGRDRRLVAGDVDRGVATLVDAGLVAHDPPARVDIWRREPPEQVEPHRLRLRVLGEVVEVQAASRWFHDAVAATCADLRTDDEPTRWMVVREVDGRARVEGPRVGWRSYDDLGALLEGFVAEVNVVVTSWAGGLALHAGAVRRPDGAVMALLGESGAGKSTLVAALVRAGWDYVTDEAVGVVAGLGVVGYPKPLSLDATSRALVGLPAGGADVPAAELRGDVAPLAGTVGPLAAAVVLAERRTEAGAETVPLGHHEVLAAVAAHALNLPEAGRVGLEALVEVSRDVPCVRLTRGDLGAAVATLGALRVRD